MIVSMITGKWAEVNPHITALNVKKSNAKDYLIYLSHIPITHFQMRWKMKRSTIRSDSVFELNKYIDFLEVSLSEKEAKLEKCVCKGGENDLHACIDILKSSLADKETKLVMVCDLAVGYDGMESIEGLKSVIDDMVKAAKGQLEIVEVPPRRAVEDGKTDN